MRLIEKKIVTETRDETVDIACDCCGELMKRSCGYEGMVLNRISFGYDSKLFGDMAEIEISCCEACLFSWVKGFKHDPRISPPWWEEGGDLDPDTL